MPNISTQSPSLNDQLRWKREMEVSQTLSQQRSPGFFPGPGAEAGGGGGGGGAAGGSAGGGSSEEQMANAAKGVLTGEVDPETAAIQLVAASIKKSIDNSLWPDVADIVDGSGFVSLFLIQIYWILSLLKVKFTTAMKMWEHVVLGFAILIEGLIILVIAVIISLIACSRSTSCASDVLKIIVGNNIFATLKLL